MNLKFFSSRVAKDEGSSARRRRREIPGVSRVEDDDGTVDERVGADNAGDERLVERVAEPRRRVDGRQQCVVQRVGSL